MLTAKLHAINRTEYGSATLRRTVGGGSLRPTHLSPVSQHNIFCLAAVLSLLHIKHATETDFFSIKIVFL